MESYKEEVKLPYFVLMVDKDRKCIGLEWGYNLEVLQKRMKNLEKSWSFTAHYYKGEEIKVDSSKEG